MRANGFCRGKKHNNFLTYFLLSIFSVFMLFPFLWMFLTALKNQNQILQVPPVIFPHPIMWSNFREALTQLPFGRAYWNSTVIAVFGVSFFVLTSLMSAYAFSKIKFPLRDKIFNFLLISLMIPFQVTMVPVLMIMKGLNLNNTLGACIIYSVFANTYGVFMLRQFIRGIPNDLIESAIIDGCGHLRIFASIIIPLTKTAISALVIFNFKSNWNNFMQPLVFIGSMEKYPVPMLLFMYQGRYTARLDLTMAAAAIALLPILAVYILFQRNIIEGIAFTGLKS